MPVAIGRLGGHSMVMLVEKLLAANQQYGSTPAVDDGTFTLTYRQVTSLAAAVRDLVRQQTSCQRVGVMLPAGGAFTCTLFGLLWDKRVVVPLNFLLSPDELRGIVEDAKIDTIIGIRHFEKMLQVLPAKVLFFDDLVELQQRRACDDTEDTPGRHAPPPQVNENDTAVILYTSGTTGKPKGAQLTYRNLHSNCEDSIVSLNLDHSYRFLNVLPPFHVFGLMACVLMPVFLGASVYAIPRFQPLRVLKTVADKGITLMLAIPSMYAALLKSKSATRETFASVKLAISGGEPLSDSVARGFEQRFGVKLRQGYGLTETSPIISACSLQHTRDGTVGRPIRNVRVDIVDPSGKELGTNQDGEIVVGSPGIMRGYYHNEEETARVIDAQGRFHTGDMGHLDDDGFLTISGRIKEMLIIGGENVYPREIEAVLEEHADVLQAAVIGVPDELRGEVPIAFVTCIEGARSTEESLRDFARQSLARFKVPRHVHIRDDLPTGPTGKILKRHLCKLL